MGRAFQLFLLSLLTLGLFLNACSQQEETEKVAYAEQSAPKKALKVVVPSEVKARWKSVDISVLDHNLSATSTYTINIGDTFRIPDSTLDLTVDTFLPSFIMNGTQMTSESNEPRNPAAYVTVMENGKKIFSGWLFSLYPDAHAFQKARYHFNLAGYTLID